jgi:hypothetical protein
MKAKICHFVSENSPKSINRKERKDSRNKFAEKYDLKNP